jgi:hypothetical protein
MPLNFPDSPSSGDPYSYGNRAWVYNGRAWVATSATIGFTGSVGPQGASGVAGSGYTGSASTGTGYTGSSGPSFINIYTSGSLYAFDGTRRWYAPYNLTVTSAVANLVGAADANVIFAIKKNGTTAATVTIPTASYTTTYSTPFAMVSGDYITISIVQAGSANTPGNDLYVQLKYTQTS